MPSNTSRISSLLEGSSRQLHIGSSHAGLIQHYIEKSDAGKYAQLNVDTSRVNFPGENITANITLHANTFNELDGLEVEFLGEVHTFGYSQVSGGSGTNANGSGGGNTQIQLEKQVFLSCSAKLRLPSMESHEMKGSISISQRSKEEPMQVDVISRLPSYLVGGKESQRLALPSIFHDGTTGKPAAFITYHWKLTTHRKSTFKSTERLYKPIMVMPLPLIQPYADPFLFQKLSYPPHHLMNSYGMYKEMKKYMLKTAALTEFELAVPTLTSWPIFRPVNVIVRLSVRAKSPSDLLEPRQFTLPLLPTLTNGDQIAGAPFFYVRRYRSSQISLSSSEIAREKSPCKCEWDSGHMNNGFTQQSDGKGFEKGREGSTPIADERAKSGLSHGWTWPARSDPRSETTYFSTPTAPFRKESLKTLLPGSNSNPPDEKTLQTYEYVSTCTLFAKVYLTAHPSIKVSNLVVSNELGFTWSMEGARNKIDSIIGNVDINLGLAAHQMAGIPQEDIIKAITSPENLNDQSPLFHTIGDQPPAILPPPFAGHERPPRYTG